MSDDLTVIRLGGTGPRHPGFRIPPPPEARRAVAPVDRDRAEAARRLREAAQMLDEGADVDHAMLALDFARIILAEHATPDEPGDLSIGIML